VGPGPYFCCRATNDSVRSRADLEPLDTLSADKIYERRWALTLLEQVLARLEDEYRIE